MYSTENKNDNKMINYKLFKHNNNFEWVTFIHGFGGDMSFWNPQLDEFKKAFNVLLVDLRGHGESKIKSNIPYSLKLASDDILEVLDFLSISKTNIIGSSFGTIIAKKFSVKYPSRTIKIILVGAIFNLNYIQNFLLNLGRLLKPILGYQGILKIFTSILMFGKNQKKERNFVVKIGQNLMKEEFDKWSVIAKTLKQELASIWKIESKIPCLILMGADDRLFLYSAKKVSSRLKNCTLKIIIHCGHIVNLAKPKEFNHLTISFFKKDLH